MFKILKYLTLLLTFSGSLLFGLGSPLFAGTVAESNTVMPAALDALPAERYAFFLEDANGELTLDDILSGAHERDFFKNAPDSSFNAGISSSVYWVRLTIGSDQGHEQTTQNTRQNNASRSGARDLLLEVPYTNLDFVTFYQKLPDGSLIEHVSGDQVSFDKRTVPHYTSVFPVKRQEGQPTTVYLKVKSSGTMRIPLRVWSEIDFLDNAKSHLLIFGLYFGALALMLLYNALFFAWLKDSNFLIYILYIASLAVFQAGYVGIGFQYLWKPFPIFNQYSIVVMMPLIGLFATLFARNILQLRKVMPRVDLFARITIAYYNVTGIACLILPYTIALYIGTVTSILQALAVIVISTFSAMRGQREARLFLTAWIAFLSGAIILAAVTLGMLPANVLTGNAMVMGSAIEIILLSVMLADRVHTTEKDKTRSEKKAKVALQAVNRALVESNRVKDEFLATISHEMRTPMNGVMNGIAQARTENDGDRREILLANAENASHQLMNLIEGVLSYTELQGSDFRIDRESFSIHQLLAPLREGYAHAAEHKGLAFELVIDAFIPERLCGDRRRIQQILVNLVDNAIKFTSSGSIEIKAMVDSIDPENHRVQLAFVVKDTGCGIAADKQGQVFERFRQVDGQHNRRHGGLGISLTVCKKIAALMGADLRFRSQQGVGSEFLLSINLPFEEAIESHANDSHEAPRQGLRALVVEDNPVNQLILKTMLAKMGMEILCANNGEEGVEAARHDNFDVILMDCQMPVMDGFEATRVIRTFNAPRGQVPIIAITANAMSRDKGLCIEAGMNDYISKPVNPRLLAEVLHKWLARTVEQRLTG